MDLGTVGIDEQAGMYGTLFVLRLYGEAHCGGLHRQEEVQRALWSEKRKLGRAWKRKQGAALGQVM